MSVFMGEMLGTATLIVLGDGVVAGVLLKQSKAENAGWIVRLASQSIFLATGCKDGLLRCARIDADGSKLKLPGTGHSSGTAA